MCREGLVGARACTPKQACARAPRSSVPWAALLPVSEEVCAMPALPPAGRREKFQELIVKERDLSNFMDGFPSRKAAKVDEMRARQDAIVGLLERINKLMVGGARAGGTAQPWGTDCLRVRHARALTRGRARPSCCRPFPLARCPAPTSSRRCRTSWSTSRCSWKTRRCGRQPGQGCAAPRCWHLLACAAVKWGAGSPDAHCHTLLPMGGRGACADDPGPPEGRARAAAVGAGQD